MGSLVANMPFADYLADDSVSQSDLKKFADNPEAYAWSKKHASTPTAAMQRGTAHHLLMEGRDDLVVCFEGTRRGKAWEEFQQENEGKLILTTGEYGPALARRDRALSAPLVADVCSHCEMWEGSMFGVDPDLLFDVKGRFDALAPKLNALVDIKTAADASPAGFQSAMARFRYHWQAAWYTDLARQLGYTIESVLFVVSEADAPFTVGLYEIDQRAVELAREEMRPVKERFLACQERGEFPGYTGKSISVLDLPSWYYKQNGGQHE